MPKPTPEQVEQMEGQAFALLVGLLAGTGGIEVRPTNLSTGGSIMQGFTLRLIPPVPAEPV